MYWIDAKLKSLEPILGTEHVLKIRQMYLFEESPRDKKAVENYIDILVAKHVKPTPDDAIILPPSERNIPTGAVHLGKVSYLDQDRFDFNINLKDLTRHAGIFGSTGSGKTTFTAKVLSELIKSDIPFIVIDWEKSYRFLTRLCPEVEVYTVGNDAINPIHFNMLDLPPGVETGEHIKGLVNLFSQDYLSGAGSDTMLLQYMNTAYAEHQNPTFAKLKEIVLREIRKDMKGKGRLAGRSGLWKETVQRIISFLSFGATASIFGTGKHYPLDKLFNRKIVLEFGSIQSPRDRKFIIHYLLNWMFAYLQERGMHHEELRQAIIMEEFHNIALRTRDDNMISQMFRQCRKYGVGLIAVDQTPSEIPNPIFANMNLMVAFNVGTSQDTKGVSGAINLDRHRAKYLNMLKVGHAVAMLRQVSAEPILLHAEHIKIDENITDNDLKLIYENSQFSSDNTHEIIERSSLHSSQADDNIPLTALEKVLLTSVAERPIDTMEARTKRLGIHPTETVKLVNSLTQKGYIRTVFVNRRKLIELTDHGKDEVGISRKTRGGIEHYYWIQMTAQFLKNLGFKPKLEHRGIDIVDPEAQIAIEIETGKSNLKRNALKLIKSNFSRRIMLTTNSTAKQKLDRLIKPETGIKTMPVQEFLKLNRDQIFQQ